MEKLAAYIRSQVNLSPDELTAILANFSKREIVKHGFVLKAGHIATNYFFVVSGGLRIYYERDNKQVTGWIAMEGEFFTDLSSLKNQSPSRFNIQALEDTELLCIKHERMEKLYKQYPLWQKFGRQIWEAAFIKVIDGIIGFQTLSAEERYIETMKKSTLLQRIPLKHLSTYLGITPSSISRIRKNIK